MSDNKYFKDLGYKVTCGYGPRVLNGEKEFHPGVDLVTKLQGPIKAFVGGKVLWSGEGVKGSGYGGYGDVVAIEDKYGCVHVYGHLSKCIAKKGATVKKDEVIGNQGNTGHSFGEHLHYEIRKEVAYVADREKRCYVPETYLEQYFEKEKPAKKEPNPKLVGRTYTTKQADVVADLTRAYGLTLAELQELNPKVNFAKLTAGIVIKLG